jgi:hypothetical protein
MRIKSLGMTRILRLSGVMLMIGLVIEAASLLFNHPLSFMGFIVIGGTLLGVGVLLFLISLVELAHPRSESPQK